MNEQPASRAPRRADPHARLRLAALAAVISGVVALAAAAFVLSYPGMHALALASGAPAALARLYPAIFDAMLVIACAAALTLRGAGWWTRCYVWLTLLALFAAVGTAGAVHAMGVAPPAQASAAATAVAPWALFLLGFGLWLAMARHLRRLRQANRAAPVLAGPVPTGAPALGPGLAADAGTAPGETGTADVGAVEDLPHPPAGASPDGRGLSPAAGDAVPPPRSPGASTSPGEGDAPADSGPGADESPAHASGSRSTAGPAAEAFAPAETVDSDGLPGDRETASGQAREQEAGPACGPDGGDVPGEQAAGDGVLEDLGASGAAAGAASADSGALASATGVPAGETSATGVPAGETSASASPADVPFERMRSAPTPPDE